MYRNIATHSRALIQLAIVPFRYSKTDHGGFGGVEIGQVRCGQIVLFGGPLTTDPSPSSPITPYTG